MNWNEAEIGPDENDTFYAGPWTAETVHQTYARNVAMLLPGLEQKYQHRTAKYVFPWTADMDPATADYFYRTCAAASNANGSTYYFIGTPEGDYVYDSNLVHQGVESPAELLFNNLPADQDVPEYNHYQINVIGIYAGPAIMTPPPRSPPRPLPLPGR